MNASLPASLLEVAAERFRLLGDPMRLRLLNHLLEHGEATVQRLAEATGQSHQNTSKHLRKLADGGLIGDRRDGLYVHYRVIDPSVPGLCLVMCGALAAR